MIKKMILMLTVGLASCSYHDDYVNSPYEVRTVSLCLSPMETSAAGTRSVLDSPGVEDMVSHATVAAYDKETGRLADAVHASSDFILKLAVVKTYNIYVIANMGDQTGRLPSSESGMEQFRCELPSYDVMNSSGLPMAGKLSTEWKGNVTIKLRRLVAKVNLRIDHSDMDSGGADYSFCNNVVKVRRAARAVFPFEDGGSSAKSADDLNADVSDWQTVADGYDDLSETLTLYIPENMQGDLLDANSNPWDKSESNSGLDASLCTYITVEGFKDGEVDGVEGDFVYRFFPGENDVRNFDLQGNMVYEITLELTWDGMYVDDNWKVEKSNWSDSRSIQVSTSEDHGYARNATLTLMHGAEDVPVYIYFSPHGEEYESELDGGEAHHYDMGWVFMPEYSPSDGTGAVVPKENNSEFTGYYMSTGLVRHTEYRTVHYVTIPATTPPGYTNRIIYMTADGRKSAWLDIVVVGSPDLSAGDGEDDDGGGDIEY